MKTFRYQLLMALVILMGVLTACEKGLETYHGNDGIYFANNKKTYLDTGMVTFAYSNSSQMDSVISIPVQALGMLQHYDRAFKVVVSDTSTAQAGVHYDALADTLKVPAGKTGGAITLKLHRTPDLQTQSVSIILQLQPNNYFHTDVLSFVNASGSTCSAVRYKVVLNDIMTQPKQWSTPYLGTFSRKKVYLMASVLGLGVDQIINAITGNDATASLNAQISYGRQMKFYLSQQASAGTPVYEDNGTLMAMGSQV